MIPGLIFLRPRIIRENGAARAPLRGGALIISNHVSKFDPMYLMFAVWYRRQRFVCLSSFFEGRGSGFFRLARCIPIDRENVSVDTLREIVSALKNGEAVTIFPEGRIGEGVEQFKSGAALMSVMSGCPIVPVYIQKPERPFSRLTAVIGEPMNPSAEYGPRPTGEQLTRLSDTLRRRELELRELAQKRGNGNDRYAENI